MTPNLQNHYQTSFKVETIDGKSDPLRLIQNIIFGWIKEKEKDKRLETNSNDFFYRCKWKKLWKSCASLATNTCFYGEVEESKKVLEKTSWAFRYSHPDSSLGEKRYWYVDVGLQKIGKVVIVYIRNSFARGQFDLSIANNIPSPKTLRFIRYIFKDNRLKVYNRDPKFLLLNKPGKISSGMGKDLADVLCDPARRYAIIIANGEDLALLEEAKKLAHDLVGKAQVFCLKKDPDLAEELRNFLSKDLYIKYNTLRIFYPLQPNNPRPKRHRWFYVDSDDYAKQREGILNGLLRNHILEEEDAITSISDVGRHVSLIKMRKLLEDGKSSSEEFREFCSMYEELEDERNGYKAEAEYWVEECDSKDQTIYELNSKLQVIKSIPKNSAIATAESVADLPTLPSNLIEVVELKAAAHSDALFVAPEALKSAEKYRDFKDLNKAWEMLHHMGTTLHKIKFGSDIPRNIAQSFTNKTGYEYACSEGKQSKADSNIRNTRKLNYEGKDYEIWAHIKSGNVEPKLLRIYFDYDEAEKKIIIGHIGAHMKNFTSKKIGF